MKKMRIPFFIAYITPFFGSFSMQRQDVQMPIELGRIRTGAEKAQLRKTRLFCSEIAALRKSKSTQNLSLEANLAKAVMLAIGDESLESLRLLAMPGSLHLKDAQGNTPLHWAASQNKPEIITSLIDEFKLDKLTVNNRGQTAVHCAAANDSVEALSRLVMLHDCPIDIADAEGNTAFHYAVIHGKREVMSILNAFGADKNKQNKKGQTPLHLAVTLNKDDLVKRLTEDAACMQTRDNLQKTPLFEAVRLGSVAVVKSLLEAKANVRETDAGGNTVLHDAVSCNRVEVVKLFVGTDIADNKNNDGNTPLHLAIRCATRDPMLIPVLVRIVGASVNIPNNKGDTPLHEAIRKRQFDAARVLLTLGASPAALNQAGITPVHMAATYPGPIALKVFTKWNKESIHVLSRERETALHRASALGELGKIKLLLKHGARTADQDDLGQTALHKAAAYGKVPALMILLALGADPKVKDRAGNIPLHIAAANGQAQAITSLIAAAQALKIVDAGPQAENNAKETPLSLVKGKHPACEKILKQMSK